jgi:hypothetical protein
MRLIVLATAICALAAAGAAAQNGNPANFMEACAADAKQLCPDTEPGQGRILRCLRANEDKLSAPCKAAFAAARAQRERQSAVPREK